MYGGSEEPPSTLCFPLSNIYLWTQESISSVKTHHFHTKIQGIAVALQDLILVGVDKTFMRAML